MKKKIVRKRPARRAAKQVKRPPVTVEPRNGRRRTEAVTISQAREEARALAERIRRRFHALLAEPEKRGKR